jgi:hypothetical protein
MSHGDSGAAGASAAAASLEEARRFQFRHGCLGLTLAALLLGCSQPSDEHDPKMGSRDVASESEGFAR